MSTIREDTVLMATLALRGMRFRHVKRHGDNGLMSFIGWYWKMPGVTNWVGAFTSRRTMLADASAHMDGRA